MAERRMFAKTIIDSDAFLDMPLTTQALYFHLAMRADDEGFINNPKKISRMIGASEDELKVLCAKRFIIPFESGIVVIKHWRIHNYIRGDRLNPTPYQEERAALELKDNGAYTLFNSDCRLTDDCPSDVSQMSVKCQSSDCHDADDCQSDVSIGKGRLGKDSIGKVSIEEPQTVPDAPAPKKKGIFQEFAGDDKELLDALRDFNDMRNKIKRQLTDKAKERLCSRLRTMFGDDHDAMIESIRESVDHSWSDVYDHREKKTDVKDIGTGRSEPVFKPGNQEKSAVNRMQSFLDELKG